MLESDAKIPIIRLWDVLLVPLQGDVTDRQARLLAEAVLAAIHTRGAAGLVLDLSGLSMVDSHLCAAFASLGGAAGLMGVPTVLCGMSPEIAFTLQTMGIELDSLRTALSLEDALRSLGVEPRRRAERAAPTGALRTTKDAALAAAMLDRNPLDDAKGSAR